LLQQGLAQRHPKQATTLLMQAIDAFRAAREERQRLRSPLDWAVTTTNLAGAVLALGTQSADSQTGCDQIRAAVDLYQEALPELTPSDLIPAVRNIAIALRVLDKASQGAGAVTRIGDPICQVLSIVARSHDQSMLDNVRAVMDELFEDIYPPPAVLRGAVNRVTTSGRAEMPPELEWPQETYAQAHKERKENILQFLARVWLPLIKVGVVDMRTLRARDPAAAKGIDNFRRKKNPVTGERFELPPHLDIPTKKQLNDRLAQQIATAGDRPARLDWALRARARRGRREKHI
jgi:hypothetical protein